MWTPRRVIKQLLIERLKRLGRSPSLLIGGEAGDGDWLPETRSCDPADALDWESLAHLTRGADPLGILVLEARELLWSDHDYTVKARRDGAVEPGAIAVPPTDDQIVRELGTTLESMQAAESRARDTIAQNLARAGLA